jgi:hypothetical protein
MKTIIAIILFSSIQFHLFAQLSGTYTIGGNQPDFKYLSEAASALVTQGVSAPVTMNIRNGVYWGFELGYIKNASALYPVIFQPESGIRDSVIIRGKGNYDDATLIYLNYTNNVTFRKITIDHIDGGTFGRGNAVRAKHCLSSSLDSCLIIGGYNNSPYYYGSEVHIENKDITPPTASFTVENCQIYTKGYGIYYYSDAGKAFIRNNIIQTDENKTIAADGTKFAEITGNYISGNIYAPNSYNIKLHNNTIGGTVDLCGLGLNMQNNIVEGNGLTTSNISTGYPVISNNVFLKRLDMINLKPTIMNCVFSDLYITWFYGGIFEKCTFETLDIIFGKNVNLRSCRINKKLSIIGDHSASGTNQMINNFVSDYFCLRSTGTWKMYHNNFNLQTIDWQGIGDLEIKGNNFVIDSSVYYLDFGLYFDSDYNNYFPEGGDSEPHHYNIDPEYKSENDLHIQNAKLSGRVPFMEIVTDDFDGESRGILNTIGADEFCLPNEFTAGPDISVHCGDSVLMTPSINYGATYHWWPSAGLSDTTVARPKVSPSETTTYFVAAQDSCGFHSDSLTVTVLPFTVDAGMNKAISCAVPFQLNATYNPGAVYSWYPADGLDCASICNPVALPLHSTKYYVTATIPGCGASTDSITLTLPTQPIAKFKANVYSNTVEFINSSTFPAYYYWDFGDNTFSTEIAPYHEYKTSGYFTVALHVTTPCGPESVYSLKIEFHVIGIGENQKPGLFNCFPNPFTDQLTIQYELTEQSDIQILLISVSGMEKIRLNKGKQSPGVYDISLPLKDLPAGVYILKIIYGDKVETRKVVCSAN